jgi:hypothetical protein
MFLSISGMILDFKIHIFNQNRANKTKSENQILDTFAKPALLTLNKY